jgi:hypothetical protein
MLQVIPSAGDAEQFLSLEQPARDATDLEMLLNHAAEQVHHFSEFETLRGRPRQLQQNCLKTIYRGNGLTGQF